MGNNGKKRGENGDFDADFDAYVLVFYRLVADHNWGIDLEVVSRAITIVGSATTCKQDFIQSGTRIYDS